MSTDKPQAKKPITKRKNATPQDAADVRAACRHALGNAGALERVEVRHGGQRYIAWNDLDMQLVVENRGDF